MILAYLPRKFYHTNDRKLTILGTYANLVFCKRFAHIFRRVFWFFEVRDEDRGTGEENVKLYILANELEKYSISDKKLD